MCCHSIDHFLSRPDALQFIAFTYSLRFFAFPLIHQGIRKIFPAIYYSLNAIILGLYTELNQTGESLELPLSSSYPPIRSVHHVLAQHHSGLTALRLWDTFISQPHLGPSTEPAMVPVHQGNTIYHPSFFFLLAGFWSLTEEHVAQIKSIHPTTHWEDSPQVWMMMSSCFVPLLGEGKVYFLQIKVPRVKNSTVKLWL